MLNLIKYEFRKTRTAKFILYGLFLVFEGILLYNLFNDRTEKVVFNSAIILLMSMIGLIVIGIQSFLTLHQDINTRQSYMLFMTPHSSYAILGAKVIECSLSVLLTGAIFFGICAADATLILQRNADIDDVVSMIRDIINAMGQELVNLDFASIASFCFELICSWLFTINAAFLADIISASLLNGKKRNGLVSFLFYVILIYFFNWLIPLFGIQSLFLLGGLYLVLAAAMYWLSAWLMDRYLSV